MGKELKLYLGLWSRTIFAPSTTSVFLPELTKYCRLREEIGYNRVMQAVRAIVMKGNQLLVMHRNKFGREYYTLIGGGIDIGETPEQALRRELREETGLAVGQVRHVFTEDAGDPYGVQYVYLCEYQGGEPVLRPDSQEAQINTLGKNLYQPVWLPVADLEHTYFLSNSVKQALLESLRSGWPSSPKTLAWQPATVAS